MLYRFDNLYVFFTYQAKARGAFFFNQLIRVNDKICNQDNPYINGKSRIDLIFIQMKKERDKRWLY